MDQFHIGRHHLAREFQQAADLRAGDAAVGHLDGRLDQRQDEAGDAEAVVGQIAHLRLMNVRLKDVDLDVRAQQVAELLSRRLIEIFGVPERVVGVESNEFDHGADFTRYRSKR